VTRPRTLVVVAGTGTEVGKTWLTAAAADALRTHGVRVAARKPAQSFGAADRGRTDADVLAAATGEHVTDVCPSPRWYEVPMAPPMAADVLGRPAFTVGELAAEVSASWPAGIDVGFVELAGGPRSPMADDGDGVDLAAALAPDLCVLVADAGLGTINAVRLCTDALTPVAAVVVFANRYDEGDDLHRRNIAWLRERGGAEVVTDVVALTSRLAPSRT
jgi:dethiobiotin synthetase